jgi:hypothetical protein
MILVGLSRPWGNGTPDGGREFTRVGVCIRALEAKSMSNNPVKSMSGGYSHRQTPILLP